MLNFLQLRTYLVHGVFRRIEAFLHIIKCRLGDVVAITTSRFNTWDVTRLPIFLIGIFIFILIIARKFSV